MVHRKGQDILSMCPSMLSYGTETWALKAENLHGLERAERMMVRWMCGVVEGQKVPCGFVQSSGIQSVAYVVRRDRLRWFGHLECKGVDD